jgi:hypothetical protein
VRRFFYDAAEGKCAKFIFKGQGGNGNQFPSMKECEAACKHADLPGELFHFSLINNLLSSFTRDLQSSDGCWHWRQEDPALLLQHQEGQVQEVQVYSGEVGNQNNKKECNEACRVIKSDPFAFLSISFFTSFSKATALKLALPLTALLLVK